MLLGCLLLCLALAALLTGLYLRFQSFSFLFMKSISSFNVHSHSLFLKCVTTSFHPYFYVQGSSRETCLTGKLIVIPTNLKNTNKIQTKYKYKYRPNTNTQITGNSQVSDQVPHRPGEGSWVCTFRFPYYDISLLVSLCSMSFLSLCCVIFVIIIGLSNYCFFCHHG